MLNAHLHSNSVSAESVSFRLPDLTADELQSADGNMMILSVIETLAESLTLADRTGVSADLMMEFVEEVSSAARLPKLSQGP